MTLFLLIAFQALDAALTMAILSANGSEVNPLLRAAFPVLGIVGTLCLAKAIAVGIGIWLQQSHRERMLRWLTEISGAVVGWNLLAVLA